LDSKLLNRIRAIQKKYAGKIVTVNRKGTKVLFASRSPNKFGEWLERLSETEKSRIRILGVIPDPNKAYLL